MELNMGWIEEIRSLIGHKRIILNGSIVFIINSIGQVLMQQRKFPYGIWGLPGGLMELGESTEETARREVFEETGLIIEELSLFGIYSGENYLCIAENGDEFYVVTTVYVTSSYSGNLLINDDETLSFKWFNTDNLPKDIPKTHKEIILDFINKI
jgi:8-oxo-dGTP pyrophosphatase MutT (NUDIX family)